MRLSKVLVLIILTMQAACQKDSDHAINVVSGIEVPFEEVETKCINAKENEWVIRSEEEFISAQIRYNDHCQRYEFPKIDFEKHMLLWYQTKAGGCYWPDVEHSVTIVNQKVIFKRVIIEYGYCKPLRQFDSAVLIPKIYTNLEIVFEEEIQVLNRRK